MFLSLYLAVEREELIQAIIDKRRQMSTETIMFHQAVADTLGLHLTDHKCLDLMRYYGSMPAGATSLMEPKDQFYGDRSGGVKDPVGNHWFIATHKEDLSKYELDKRAKEYVRQQQQQRKQQ
jgi:hypothetical protein